MIRDTGSFVTTANLDSNDNDSNKDETALLILIYITKRCSLHGNNNYNNENNNGNKKINIIKKNFVMILVKGMITKTITISVTKR